MVGPEVMSRVESRLAERTHTAPCKTSARIERKKDKKKIKMEKKEIVGGSTTTPMSRGALHEVRRGEIR